MAVSHPFRLSPDPMPLREALRGLRHVLRRGGESLRETGLTETLPQPAAQLAETVLRGASTFAQNVDQVASELAKTVLGGQEMPAERFNDIVAQDDAAARFGAAAYTALRVVLRQLGAHNAFISEAAARKVFARHHGVVDASRASGTDVAAITLALIDARIVRGVDGEEATRVPHAMLQPVAVFAVMLWLQSDRSEAENQSALAAACDLSVAVAQDVAAICAAKDAARLARLYAELVPHV